jgi:hypothetical protein
MYVCVCVCLTLYPNPYTLYPIPYQSDAGKAYIGFTVQKTEDRKFLHSGMGASYLIEGGEGVLPPWGVVVSIMYHNNRHNYTAYTH